MAACQLLLVGKSSTKCFFQCLIELSKKGLKQQGWQQGWGGKLMPAVSCFLLRQIGKNVSTYLFGSIYIIINLFASVAEMRSSVFSDPPQPDALFTAILLPRIAVVGFKLS